MTTVLLNTQNLEFLKKISRELYPKVGSSHLTEAIAVGLGFNKHASLLSALKHKSSRLHAVAFSETGMVLRLQQLVKDCGQTDCRFEVNILQFNQHDLPVSCWQSQQSNAIYYKYSRLNLPIIFIKDSKRKYCTLDYDYHFSDGHAIKGFDFREAKGIAVQQLLVEFQRLAKLHEMPISYFEGQLGTGWITKVQITKVEAFANNFALAYFALIRELEIEVDRLRQSAAS